MTADLRQRALSSGWHPDVVENMHVQFGDEGFKVNIHEDHAEKAWIHEYGNETSRPTALLRKYANDDSDAKNMFMSNVIHHGKERR
jgi:hypothetical protein